MGSTMREHWRDGNCFVLHFAQDWGMTRKQATPVYKQGQRPDLARGLQRLRDERRLNLREMAEQLGVKLPTYYAWEKGERFPNDLGGLLDKLGVTLTSLFDVSR